jgi:metal-dependent hydrolase (beta-lactamase superfamily II)
MKASELILGFASEAASKRGRILLSIILREALPLMNVDVTKIKNVIITHLHYDHVGTFDEFPICTISSSKTMRWLTATGRFMRHKQFNHGYEVDEVVGTVKMVFKDRVKFSSG